MYRKRGVSILGMETDKQTRDCRERAAAWNTVRGRRVRKMVVGGGVRLEENESQECEELRMSWKRSRSWREEESACMNVRR